MRNYFKIEEFELDNLLTFLFSSHFNKKINFSNFENFNEYVLKKISYLSLEKEFIESLKILYNMAIKKNIFSYNYDEFIFLIISKNIKYLKLAALLTYDNNVEFFK